MIRQLRIGMAELLAENLRLLTRGVCLAVLLMCFWSGVGESDESNCCDSLILALTDSSTAVRWQAQDSLVHLGASAVDELTDVLVDEFAGNKLRVTVARLLGAIGPDAATAVPYLLDIIKDNHARHNLRGTAIRAAGEIGPSASCVVPVFREMLTDTESSRFWRLTVEALGRIGKAAGESVPEVINYYLRCGTDEERSIAENALIYMGTAVSDTLVHMITDTLMWESYRVKFIGVLTAIEPHENRTLELLVARLADSTESRRVREAAATALGRMGGDAAQAVPALLEAMSEYNRFPRLHRAAQQSLIEIGDASVRPLIGVVKDTNQHWWCREAAIATLGGLGKDARSAVPFLARIIEDTTSVIIEDYPELAYSWGLKNEGIKALGRIGSASSTTIPVLIGQLNSFMTNNREASAIALMRIAEQCVDDRRFEPLEGLKEAYDSVKNLELLSVIGRTDWDDEHLSRFRRAIESLEMMARSSLWHRMISLISLHPILSRLVYVVLVYSVLLVICWLFLRLRPLWILSVNDFLRSLQRINQLWKSLGWIVRYLIVVRFFNYHSRVLDAWIESHRENALERFCSLPSVRVRLSYVDMPIVLDDIQINGIRASQLRSILRKKRFRLLVHGYGGSGKTSIAFQIGIGALRGTSNERLNESHAMIPVLIEDVIHDERKGKHDALITEVQGRLRDVIGCESKPDSELVKFLLLKRRLLLIIDRFSELDPESRKHIRPHEADFPANAMIVTSRMREKLGGCERNELEPVLLRHNNLFDFFHRYLDVKGDRDQFDDDEFGDMVARLSRIVAGREIPILIAKLFCDAMITSKSDLFRASAPDSVPDLILQYVNSLNETIGSQKVENNIVHSALKKLAYVCVSKSFRPEKVGELKAKNALTFYEHPDRLLSYIVDKLKLMARVQPQESEVRFLIDPVAEYYAAMHVTDEIANDTDRWLSLIKRIKDVEGFPEATAGFTLALYDCVSKKNDDGELSDEVVRNTISLTNLAESELEKVRLRKRLKRLHDHLKAPEVEDRISAAEAAKEIGEDAAYLVPPLIENFHWRKTDDDRKASQACSEALVRIGDSAVPLLLELFDDGDSEVRELAVHTIGEIRTCSQNVLNALTDCLRDESGSVKRNAAIALGECGPDAVSAVEPLVSLLSNEDEDVKASAAIALSQIGSIPESAVEPLEMMIEYGEPDVASAAVTAIGGLGREVIDRAVRILKKALQGSSKLIIERALGVAVRLGSTAYQLYPEMLKLLDNDYGERLSVNFVGGEQVIEIACTYDDHPICIAIPLVEALASAGRHGVRDLIDKLKNSADNSQVRVKVLLSIASIEKEASDAMPHLRTMMQAGNSREKLLVAFTISRLLHNADNSASGTETTTLQEEAAIQWERRRIIDS